MSLSSLDINEYHWYYAYSSALDIFHFLDVGAPIAELLMVFVAVAYICAFREVSQRPAFLTRILNLILVGDSAIVGVTLWQFLTPHDDATGWLYHHPGVWAAMIIADFTKQVGVWYFLYQYLKVASFIPLAIQPQPVHEEKVFSLNPAAQLRQHS